jgi:hypothetical protein
MHVVITTIIITGIPLLLFLRALLELRNPVVESSNQMNVHWQVQSSYCAYQVQEHFLAAVILTSEESDRES